MTTIKRKLLVALFLVVSLSSCESLEGLGKGLSDLFKNIKIPMP
jgi:predicted small secreted protein